MKSVLKYTSVLGFGFILGKFIQPSEIFAKTKIATSNTHTFHNVLNDYGELQPFDLISRAYQGMKALGNENFFFKIQNQLEGFNQLEYFAPSESLSYVISKSELPEKERKDICKLGCIFELSDSLQGHKGVAHGGFICTLFDTNFGNLTIMSTQLKPSMTAYLNVSYKKPLKTNEKYIMITELDRIEGRKVFVNGKILDKNGEIVSHSEALFIILRDPMPISPFLSAIRNIASLRESVESYVKKVESEPFD